MRYDWSYIFFLLDVLKVWILKSKRWSWEERRSGYRSGEWRGSAVSLSLTQPTMSLPVSQKHMRWSRSAPSHKFQSWVSKTHSQTSFMCCCFDLIRCVLYLTLWDWVNSRKIWFYHQKALVKHYSTLVTNIVTFNLWMHARSIPQFSCECKYIHFNCDITNIITLTDMYVHVRPFSLLSIPPTVVC